MSALIPAAAFAAVGVAWVSSGLPSIFWYSIVLLAVALAASVLPWVAHSPRGYRRVVTAGFACVGFLVGATAARPPSPASLPVALEAVDVLRGVVMHADADRVTIALQGARGASIEGDARGAVYAMVVDETRLSDVRVGASVSIVVPNGDAWIRPDGALGARASAIYPDDDPVNVRFVRARNALAVARESFRTRVSALVDDIAGSAAPLLRALLLGESSQIDPRIESLFRRSGTIHLLALSGMHLAVIALLVRVLVGRIARPHVARWTAVLASLGYLWIAGPRPGLVRAVLLAAIASILADLDRRRQLVELLAIAMLIQLVIQPSVARTLGFQLSYLSLFGIAFAATPIARTIERFVPPAVASPLGAGIGAQLATTPLLLLRFGVWYPAGIVASVVMTPVILVFMTLGIVAVTLGAAGGAMITLVARPVLEILGRAAESAAWFFAAAPGVTTGRHAWIRVLASVAVAVIGFAAAHRGSAGGWNEVGRTR